MSETRATSGLIQGRGGTILAKLMHFGALPIVLVLSIIVFQFGNDRFLSSNRRGI